MRYISRNWMSMAGIVLLAGIIGTAGAVDLNLTAEEQSWLDQHPVIRVTSEPDYPPFDFVQAGRPVGYSIDYLKLLEPRIGLKFEYVQAPWGELLERARKKEVDLVHTIFKTPERTTFLHFTKPYKTVVNAIFVHSAVSDVQQLSDLAGKKVILAKGDSMVEMLPKEVPAAIYSTADSYPEVLKAIQLRQADATVLDSAVASYHINELSLPDVKVVSEALVEFEEHAGRYRLAVRNDWPIFTSILEKAPEPYRSAAWTAHRRYTPARPPGSADP